MLCGARDFMHRICIKIHNEYACELDEYVYSQEYTACGSEYGISKLDMKNIHVYSCIFLYISKKCIHILRSWWVNMKI